MSVRLIKWGCSSAIRIQSWQIGHDKGKHHLFNWLSKKRNATFPISTVDLDGIVTFLRAQHQPNRPQAQRPHSQLTRQSSQQSTPLPPQTQAPHHRYLCQRCNSDSLIVLFKHSYYFKCRQCNGNMSINEWCKDCRGKKRIRKSGRQFFLDCERCKTSVAFYTNQAS